MDKVLDSVVDLVSTSAEIISDAVYLEFNRRPYSLSYSEMTDTSLQKQLDTLGAHKALSFRDDKAVGATFLHKLLSMEVQMLSGDWTLTQFSTHKDLKDNEFIFSSEEVLRIVKLCVASDPSCFKVTDKHHRTPLYSLFYMAARKDTAMLVSQDLFQFCCAYSGNLWSVAYNKNSPFLALEVFLLESAEHYSRSTVSYIRKTKSQKVEDEPEFWSSNEYHTHINAQLTVILSCMASQDSKSYNVLGHTVITHMYNRLFPSQYRVRAHMVDQLLSSAQSIAAQTESKSIDNDTKIKSNPIMGTGPNQQTMLHYMCAIDVVEKDDLACLVKHSPHHATMIDADGLLPLDRLLDMVDAVKAEKNHRKALPEKEQDQLNRDHRLPSDYDVEGMINVMIRAHYNAVTICEPVHEEKKGELCGCTRQTRLVPTYIAREDLTKLIKLEYRKAHPRTESEKRRDDCLGYGALCLMFIFLIVLIGGVSWLWSYISSILFPVELDEAGNPVERMDDEPWISWFTLLLVAIWMSSVGYIFKSSSNDNVEACRIADEHVTALKTSHTAASLAEYFSMHEDVASVFCFLQGMLCLRPDKKHPDKNKKRPPLTAPHSKVECLQVKTQLWQIYQVFENSTSSSRQKKKKIWKRKFKEVVDISFTPRLSLDKGIVDVCPVTSNESLLLTATNIHSGFVSPALTPRPCKTKYTLAQDEIKDPSAWYVMMKQVNTEYQGDGSSALYPYFQFRDNLQKKYKEDEYKLCGWRLEETYIPITAMLSYTGRARIDMNTKQPYVVLPSTNYRSVVEHGKASSLGTWKSSLSRGDMVCYEHHVHDGIGDKEKLYTLIKSQQNIHNMYTKVNFDYYVYRYITFPLISAGVCLTVYFWFHM